MKKHCKKIKVIKVKVWNLITEIITESHDPERIRADCENAGGGKIYLH